MAATTGYCRSPSPEHCRPNPRATGLALMSRPISHYSHFFYRPEQAFAAAVPASYLTSTADLCRPRMRVDGEHVMLPTSPRFGHRRAGAPLVLSSPSLAANGRGEERRREEEGEEKEKETLTGGPLHSSLS
uniref:Uncharacterized protein n=1 Tax=Oryza nivara TaxID=4536 RepID=A0A0E0INR0_ORYNI